MVTVFGICNISARTATVLAPLIAEVGKPIPLTIFSIVSFSCAVSSMFIITEPLPADKMQDMEKSFAIIKEEKMDVSIMSGIIDSKGIIK